MKQTFYLRKPKEKNETLILFSCHFKNEQKQFVYSTKKSIQPIHWDFENRKPKNKGKVIATNHKVISNTLHKYSAKFDELLSNCALADTEFTSQLLKQSFDRGFRNVATKKTTFFEVYDLFTEEKEKRKEWKEATIKRYKNIKNLLLEFEKVKKYKLTFSKINSLFYTEFLDFCYKNKSHFSNTVHRNVGLFKTFMNWALKKEYTYNRKFIDFKKPKKVLTRQEALSLEDIKILYDYDCKDEVLEKVKDVFIFQCFTGIRFGDLKLINERIVNQQNSILLNEEKSITKPPREIPLIAFSKEILLKYNYRLPLLSNQQHNNHIKEILKGAGFTREVEYARAQGAEQHIFVNFFYDRISTHTARRSFVTIMRNKGVADKTIMSITGHKDIKTFNMYHQVNNTAKIDAVKFVFDNFKER